MKKILFTTIIVLSFISCISEEDRKAQDTIDECIWNLVGKNYDFYSEFATKIGEITTYDEYVLIQKENREHNQKAWLDKLEFNRNYENIVSNLSSLGRELDYDTCLRLRTYQTAENISLDILGKSSGIMEKETFTKIHIYRCAWEYNDAKFYNTFYLNENLTFVDMIRY